jgi:hypothetical protein
MWRFLLAGLVTVCGLVLLFMASMGDPMTELRDARRLLPVIQSPPSALTPQRVAVATPAPAPQPNVTPVAPPPAPSAQDVAAQLQRAQQEQAAQKQRAEQQQAAQKQREELEQQVRSLREKLDQSSQDMSTLRNEADSEKHDVEALRQQRAAEQAELNRLKSTPPPLPTPNPPPPQLQPAPAAQTQPPAHPIDLAKTTPPERKTTPPPQPQPAPAAQIQPPAHPIGLAKTAPPDRKAAPTEKDLASPVVKPVLASPEQGSPANFAAAEAVLNRLRHSPPSDTTTVDATDAQPQPSASPGGRLSDARRALRTGRIDEARSLLEQAQVQLVFRPVNTSGDMDPRGSVAAGDVAEALSMLNSGDIPDAERYVDLAMRQTVSATQPVFADERSPNQNVLSRP